MVGGFGALGSALFLDPQTLCPLTSGAQTVWKDQTTSPYGEGKSRVLGDTPGPREGRGAPAPSSGQPRPPGRSVLPGHTEGVGNVVVFQFPENLQAEGDRPASADVSSPK